MDLLSLVKRAGRIGVLLGGLSSERDISLKSGNAVYQALASLGCDVIKIDVKKADFFKEDILASEIAAAFIALHGKFGEDGTVQSLLEDMDIPYTGSGPEASRLALDKPASKGIFTKSQIPTPAYMVIKRAEKSYCLRQDKGFFLPLPFVVKPSGEGSSIGMSIVEDYDMLTPAIEEAFKHDDELIIEEYIRGDDITVGILNNKPLPVIRIRPKEKFYNYKAKYTSGMSEYIVPADLPDETANHASRLGLMAHKALGCDSFSRVDMMISRQDNAVTVLEVNTIPGFTENSLLPKAANTAGINFPNMCLEMLKSALEKSGSKGAVGSL